MELVTRQEAIAQQLSRYYTGKPCKHGHISERYTRISACIECLHPTFDAKDIRARREARERLSLVVHGMMQINIRLHPNDVDLFEAMLLAAAMAREPDITLSHLKARGFPKHWGGGLFRHTFRCFPGDESVLRGLQDSLESARRPVTTEAIAQGAADRLTAVLAAANAEADRNWPEFKP